MRSTKKRRKLVNLPTYYKRIFPLLFAWMILLTTCAGSQSDVLRMKSTEKASGQTMLSGERLAKTYDALLETARGRSETLESGRADSYLGYDDRWWCRRTFVHGLSCFGYADNSGVEDFPQGEIPYSDL